MHGIIGKKQTQTQRFLEDGTRIPVTLIEVNSNPVVMVKTADKDGYIAVQLGYGTKKNPSKAITGHSKKGALEKAPSFFAEVRFPADAKVEDLPKPGDKVEAPAVLEAGDLVDITGTAKGKGFAGVVKRHKFRGGPRTHGQSDRERAPGSIGQTTTPGRVYKGKRMAGKMGNQTVTLQNLEIVEVTPTGVTVKGLVPGVRGAMLFIKKIGKNKNFTPLFKQASDVVEEAKEVKSEAVIPVTEEQKA